MSMKQGKTQHKLSGVITRAALVAPLFASAFIPAYAASTTVHTATAYGAEVKVGGIATVGPIAVSELPLCSTQSVGSFSASALSVSTGLLTTGNIATNASSTATSSTATSEVSGISLLGGLITATAIEAVSTSSVSGGVFSSSAAGTTFTGLSVLGIPIAANVAPNTVIKLPGVGSVTLNEQIFASSPDKSELTIKMIDVKITHGLNSGSEVIVAKAVSEIKTTTAPAVVGGYAYAPKLVAGPITSGPIVLETIPCFGTFGVVDTDSVASTDIPDVVTTGTVTVTGFGKISNTSATAESTSSIAGIDLLSELVGATAITGDAKATTADGVTFNFTGGSTFVGLTVAGHPEITDSVAPNTKISIAGVGTLYFNRVKIYADKIKVTPIELLVDTDISPALPIGADLTLGVVEAQLHSTDIP